MRRAGLLVIGIGGLVAVLAAGGAGQARPRFGPGIVFGLMRAPLGMLGLGHLRARHAYRYGYRHRVARRALAAGGLGAAALASHGFARQAAWSGPVFWPSAYDDMFGYVARSADLRFWGGGFSDVLAGMFGQPGSEERGSPRARLGAVASADSGTTGAGAATSDARACGTLTAQSVDDVMTQLAQTVRPKPSQQAAFKDLRSAVGRAADDLRSACPRDTALTPLARLAAMQQRLWAMQSAALLVRTPFAKLLVTLDEDQKARLDAVSPPAPERRANMRRHRRHAEAAAAAAPVQICFMQSRAAAARPSEQIAERVRPTEQQQAGLKTLAEASGNMTKLMLGSCPDKPPANALARLDAVLARLEAMLYAINVINPPLQNFYGSLTDEQKARFNSLGAAAS